MGQDVQIMMEQGDDTPADAAVQEVAASSKDEQPAPVQEDAAVQQPDDVVEAANGNATASLPVADMQPTTTEQEASIEQEALVHTTDTGIMDVLPVQPAAEEQEPAQNNQTHHHKNSHSNTTAVPTNATATEP